MWNSQQLRVLPGTTKRRAMFAPELKDVNVKRRLLKSTTKLPMRMQNSSLSFSWHQQPSSNHWSNWCRGQIRRQRFEWPPLGARARDIQLWKQGLKISTFPHDARVLLLNSSFLSSKGGGHYVGVSPHACNPSTDYCVWEQLGEGSLDFSLSSTQYWVLGLPNLEDESNAAELMCCANTRPTSKCKHGLDVMKHCLTATSRRELELRACGGGLGLC